MDYPKRMLLPVNRSKKAIHTRTDTVAKRNKRKGDESSKQRLARGHAVELTKEQPQGQTTLEGKGEQANLENKGQSRRPVENHRKSRKGDKGKEPDVDQNQQQQQLEQQNQLQQQLQQQEDGVSSKQAEETGRPIRNYM
ncbi:hypothetical protein ElyMa_001885500 [Elysia marginata]|uniref:Uncharacterized protein n=1 Tax=Elysia marginata TaxID=1093978 RepID=A0AAV4ERK0_9GAST|nr:hypothetical protein ElyMa_001885500 [Elysia marginata]